MPKDGLPVLNPVLAKLMESAAAPTVDKARSALGGRGSTGPEAGTVVAVPGGVLGRDIGVVVYASATERDVWVGGGKLKRVPADRVEAATDGEVTAGLLTIAGEARAFAALDEGQAVRFQTKAGEVKAGTLVEKCRYGALVLDDDDKVLAVSFRRIIAAAVGTS